MVPYLAGTLASLETGNTPLYWAQKNRRSATAALLQADPRVASAITSAEPDSD